MYIVIVEWDGSKPPTTFYNRLHDQFGLYVRGNKAESPMNRRASRREKGEGSVIAQEGAILCASESLAREIAVLAMDHGAVVVKVGSVEAKDFYATTEDIRIHDRIEALAGKIGRPSGDTAKFTVLCMEEMQTFVVDDVRYVAVCPQCKGTRIKTFLGEVSGYMWPQNTPNYDAWRRHRFVDGQFRIPINVGPQLPDAPSNIVPKAEEATVAIIEASVEFLEKINKIGSDHAAKILDGVFSARTYTPIETRKTKRVEAAIYLLQDGRANPTEFSLAEDPKRVDVLDAASVLGSVMAGQLWLAINGQVTL